MNSLDTTLIEETIGVVALCANCILRISDLQSCQLNDALPRLIGSLRVKSTLGTCNACLKEAVVHSRRS